MGNEDPLFVLALGAIALLIIATAIFIPTQMVLLFIREWRRRKGS